MTDIEYAVTKKYPQFTLKKFTQAIKEYRLVSKDDKIAVCISGGKDSMLMAKLFQLHQKYGGVDYDIVFLVMNPGYSPKNLQKIKDNAELLKIPIEIFDSDIFEAVYEQKNPCFLCSKMRRGLLYKKAQELGCNKISLGHHFDDVIETILMSVIYGGQTETMLPRVKSAHFPGMELIRPMYYIREGDIIRLCNECGLEFLQCACRFTEQNSSENHEQTSKRKAIKRLISELAKDNPQVEMNIFNSVKGIKLNKIMSYKNENGIHSFLEKFSD